jgi:hypothetical protein
MGDTNTLLAGLSIGGLVSLFFIYIRLKKHLKEEIVDPDIRDLKREIDALKEDFGGKLTALQDDRALLSSKIDTKFAELNRKLDKQAQDVAKMQGMLTAMFNGIRETNAYGQ